MITKKSDEYLASVLEYELAPIPLALFNDGCMRKTEKTALRDVLPYTDTIINFNTNVINTDSGFLLGPLSPMFVNSTRYYSNIIQVSLWPLQYCRFRWPQ